MRHALAFSLLALATPQAALACGGFFCSSVPIDQTKERIVFGIDTEQHKVETHVQIFYTGEDAEFSWIVPVKGTPELGLSTDALFQQLDWQTAPQFWLQQEERGTCEYDAWWGGFGLYPEAAAEDDADEDGAGGGVVILQQSQVGPYDTVVLSADSSEALLGWLGDNGYTIPEAVGTALAPYVTDGNSFIALKLHNDRDVGDIAPIKFTYDGDAASIPIILTAIAASPDMRVQPFIFADHRAVPDNYFHVKINEAAIDWLSYGANYDDVITRAANEAGGQAFATDYAGTTVNFRNQLWTEGRYRIGDLANTDDPARFVNKLLEQGFPRTPQVQNLIRHFIPMPQAAIDAGIDESSFYNCLDCYPEYVSQVDFDAEAFAHTLDEVVVQPLHDAEQLFQDHDYLTRMTSSMSADEMTVDPVFVLNPDMGDVANTHQAKYVIDCGDGGKISESPAWIELADGTTILVPPGTWFLGGGVWEELAGDLASTAAAVVEDADGEGLPVVVTDQGQQVQDDVADHNLAIEGIYDDEGIRLPQDVLDDLDEQSGGSGGGCGCTTQPAPAWSAALLGLLGFARRRR